ncbi:hypothetical protein ST47_g8099 [Ascochyta rabiei]|uniref:Uncharacterized protein n=2 Tax=Didymella rabiei TaxID=5454 RepID=A0A162ZSK7_DIDRA|nr:hypothetical protein ST47_g8099 [Ascochyta rabiei]
MTEQSVQNPTTNKNLASVKEQSVDGTHATLARSAVQEWFSTILDALLSLAPLFFLVIASLSLSLDGKPISSFGQNIKAITLLSPTIFPIVYAAILGKVLRRIGLFKAERSSTIGTLEQLIGSQSFFASIERQFGMRRISFLGVAIIAAWLLSPVGGQSSLRLLSTTLSKTAVDGAVRYLPSETFRNDTLFGVAMAETTWGRYAPLYMTSLQTSRLTVNASRDLFGNVRIPDITSLDTASDPTVVVSDWRHVPEDGDISYTSLLGYPTIDVPRVGNVLFTIESTYWEVRCNPFTKGAPFVLNETIDVDPYKGHLGPGTASTSFAMLLKDSGGFNTSLPGNRKIQLGFDYVSKISMNSAINSSCAASLQLVESEVGCDTGICRVQRMRDSKRDPLYLLGQPSYWGNDRSWSGLFRMLCETMPGTDLGPDNPLTRSSELVERFIYDPSLKTLSTSGVDKYKNTKAYWLNMTDIPVEMFSRRLQTAMNTFWDSTIELEYRLGNLTHQDIEGGNTTLKNWNSTTATGMRYDGEHYVCHVPFAVLTIAISFLLFVAAAVSVVLGFMTRAPDILGYVSTYARDDPYFGHHVPSHMDGLETARALRDVRVIVGDVHKEDEVGHVAFASMEREPDRVNKQRLYD